MRILPLEELLGYHLYIIRVSLGKSLAFVYHQDIICILLGESLRYHLYIIRRII